MREKTFNLMIVLIIYKILFISSVYANDEPPQIVSKNGVVIDAYDGEVLLGKGEYDVVYPASVTKVLTALLAEEMLNEGEIITASKEATEQEPSNQMYLLQEGEEITKEDAIKLIMMISSNDVSYAIAEHIGGDIEGFAKKMNEKAEELGAERSNFVNASGLPDENHVTTAYDMALIGREVVKYPFILEAMREKTFDLKTNKQEVKIERTNSIFENNKNAIGGKTGWTISSGNTLLEISEKNDGVAISVVMGADGKEMSYSDIKTLSKYGLENIETLQIFDKGDKVTEIDINGKMISLYASDDIKISSKGRSDIENRITLLEKDKYEPKETVAYLEIISNNEVESSYELHMNDSLQLLSEDIGSEEVSVFESVKETENIAMVLFMIFGIPFLVFLLLNAISFLKNKRKSKNNIIKASTVSNLDQDFWD